MKCMVHNSTKNSETLTWHVFISTIPEPDFALFFFCLSFSYPVLSRANGEACNRRSSRDAKPQLFIFHFPIAFAVSKTDEPRDLYSEKQIVSTCNHRVFFSFFFFSLLHGRLKGVWGSKTTAECPLVFSADFSCHLYQGLSRLPSVKQISLCS